MTKKKDELATQNHSPLAVADGGGRAWELDGIEQSDLELARVVIHQGDTSAKYYGDHPKGALVNSLTLDAISSDIFVPVGIGYKEYVGWEDKPGDGAPLYRTRNKREVPPEDFEWVDGQPPRCQQQVYILVLFEGDEIPIALRISLTNKYRKSAVTTIHNMETARAGRGSVRGMYRLATIDVENDKGRWKDPKIEPQGNASGELLAAANNWYDMLSHRSFTVQEEDAAYDPELDG